MGYLIILLLNRLTVCSRSWALQASSKETSRSVAKTVILIQLCQHWARSPTASTFSTGTSPHHQPLASPSDTELRAVTWTGRQTNHAPQHHNQAFERTPDSSKFKARGGDNRGFVAHHISSSPGLCSNCQDSQSSSPRSPRKQVSSDWASSRPGSFLTTNNTFQATTSSTIRTERNIQTDNLWLDADYFQWKIFLI